MNYLKKYYNIYFYKSRKIPFENVPPYQLQIIKESPEFEVYSLYLKRLEVFNVAFKKISCSFSKLNNGFARSWTVVKDLKD